MWLEYYSKSYGSDWESDTNQSNNINSFTLTIIGEINKITVKKEEYFKHEN